MRLIVQTKDVDFLSMNGQLVYKIFQIAERLQIESLSNDRLVSLFFISQDEFNIIKKYFVFTDGLISGFTFISSFSKNKEYVRKSRSKVKSPQDSSNNNTADYIQSPVAQADVPVAPKPVKVKKSVIKSEEADMILNSYNNIFAGTKVCLVKVVGDKMLAQVKHLHKTYGKDKDFGNFLADYYEVLLKNKGVVNGWFNNNTGELYRPTFDYLHRPKTYEKYFNQQI